MQRIHVIGTSGSGKTFTARRLAACLDLEHIELDALYWGPDWTPKPNFREVLAARLEADRWAVDGNYRARARDLLWARADTIVWLDLPRRTVMRQVTARTWQRWAHGERLWNGNRESLRKTLFTTDSILWWAWTSFQENRDRYHELLPGVSQQVIHIHSRAELDRWLEMSVEVDLTK